MEKKFRVKGKVIGKRITKKGSFMFTIKTAKTGYDVVVPKYKKNQSKIDLIFLDD